LEIPYPQLTVQKDMLQKIDCEKSRCPFWLIDSLLFHS
jgi:hypothetical protein